MSFRPCPCYAFDSHQRALVPKQSGPHRLRPRRTRCLPPPGWQPRRLLRRSLPGSPAPRGRCYLLELLHYFRGRRHRLRKSRPRGRSRSHTLTSSPHVSNRTLVERFHSISSFAPIVRSIPLPTSATVPPYPPLPRRSPVLSPASSPKSTSANSALPPNASPPSATAALQPP